MKSHRLIPVLAAALALCAPALAQQSQPQATQQIGGGPMPVQPITTESNSGDSGAVPTARGLFVGYQPQGDNSTAQIEPDDSPLSGIETFSLGILRSFTTIFDPSVFVTESGQTGLTPGVWNSATSVGGGLAIVRDWNHARITAQYFGAQSFYRPGTQFNGSYHTLSLAQATRFGRWGLLVRDDVYYTRMSNFGGFATAGVAPSSGVGSGSSLQPGLTPAETILTGQVGTINNTAAVQATYAFSHRTSLTLAGTFGVLTFDQPGYIDSRTWTGTIGYNYALSRLNTFATLYTYAEDDFNGTSARAQTHTMQAAFGRKITGRLALQAAAGPQIELSRNSFGVQSASQLSWAASTSLTYGPRPRNISYTIGYAHGLTSGSGVFYGAESDTVTASMNIGTGRSWSAIINAGFASNRSLVGATGFSATRYDNWFGGATFNRTIGRQIQFSMTYEYLHQYSNGGCPVVSCGISAGPQTASVRLQWTPWPARIR